MINLDLLQRAIDTTPGEVIGVTKEQLRQMAAEMRLGQQARRVLTNVRTMATLAPEMPA